jgi:hypothetical protein
VVELKSKKNGLVQIISDEDYKMMTDSGFNMKIYKITVLNSRPIIPAIKKIELKKTIIKKTTKNEG